MKNDPSYVKASTKFCHFTDLDSARKILSSGCFYLSKYSAMNDLDERSIHDDEADTVFALSFCHSEAFNIPVIYLYGGIDGKGCRIQFTDTKMRAILQNCKVYYVNKQNNRLRREIDPSAYEVMYDWVYYISRDGYCEHYGDADMMFPDKETAIHELAKNDLHYFIKSPIWKYEKEFRIVIKFHDDVKYGKIALAFDMASKERGISLACGPETTVEEFGQIREEFDDYGIMNIQRYSEDRVSMKLVEKNKWLYK